MEKKFNFNEKYGFNWHKSWNLPVIKVNIEVIIKKKISFNYNLIHLMRLLMKINKIILILLIICM